MQNKKNVILIIVSLLFMPLAWSEGMRDPTRPVNYTPAGSASTAMELSAILYSPHRKLAVINGEVKEEGDEIVGNRLISIKKTFVLLDGPNGRTKLYLLEQSVVPGKDKSK